MLPAVLCIVSIVGPEFLLITHYLIVFGFCWNLLLFCWVFFLCKAHLGSQSKVFGHPRYYPFTVMLEGLDSANLCLE